MSKDDLWVVQNGYVGNCMVFWALNDNGYTCDPDKIQTYTKEEALSRCRYESNEKAWPLDEIKQAIRPRVEAQSVDYDKCIRPAPTPPQPKPRHSDRCGHCGKFIKSDDCRDPYIEHFCDHICEAEFESVNRRYL